MIFIRTRPKPAPSGLRPAPPARPPVRTAPAWLFGLSLCAVSFASGSHLYQRLSAPLRAEEAPAPRLRPCPHCDPKGRMTCPDCGGTGKLMKVCPTCNGTGLRPCRVCNKEGKELPPGQIECDYCGGKGFLEGRRSRKTCPQCRGTAVIKCPACLGKGGFKCPPERVDRICPRCRLTGKIPCTYCGGTHLLPVEVAAGEKPGEGEERLPEGTSTGIPEADAASGGESESGGETPLDAPAATGEPAAGPEAVLKRAAEVLERHGSTLGDATADRIEELRVKIRALEALLRRSGVEAGDALRQELDAVQERLRHLASRQGEIADLYARLERSYRGFERAWNQRKAEPEAPQSFAPDLQVVDPLEIRANVTRKLLHRLGEERPEWILEELEELASRERSLEERVKERIRKLEEEKAQKAGESGNGGGRAEARSEDTPGSKRGNGPSGAAEGTASPAKSSPASGSEGGWQGGRPPTGVAAGLEAGNEERSAAGGGTVSREARGAATRLRTAPPEAAPPRTETEEALQSGSRSPLRFALWAAAFLVALWAALVFVAWLKRHDETRRPAREDFRSGA